MSQYLPPELLHIIFTDVRITQDDLKSFRLVSRSWTDNATVLLFRRIPLSRLKKDRDAFFNIASRSHLATCARVLVWYELGNDIPDWYTPDHSPDAEGYLESLDEDANTQFFYSELSSQILDLFWFSLQIALRGDKTPSEAVNKEMHKLEDFMIQFYDALDAMPNLHTLVSQPMHPCRLLTKSPTAYPITAQLLSGGLRTVGSHLTQTTHALLHLGLRMHRITRAPKDKLTRFYYADIHESSAFPNIRMKYLSTLFPKLTHLDLCIGTITNPKDLYELRDFISAAKCLTHLRLCFERSYLTSLENGPYDSKAHVILGHPEFHLPQLCYLHLTDMRISPSKLLRVVKKHASTLRVLRIYDNLSPAIIKSFVNMMMLHELELDDLVIIPINEEESWFIQFDDSFKNGQIIRNGAVANFVAMNIFAYVRSQKLCYDINDWRTAALIDSRYASAQWDYLDSLKFLDSENGDSRDIMGVPLQIEYIDEATLEPDNNISQESGQDATEAREQASHIRRLWRSPWWIWESFHHGTPQMFNPTASQKADLRYLSERLPILCPTVMWLFQHRNGETAVGKEPLEF
ncbi:hypothetical protein F4781DRAFT_143001 [Annulohypoxylon bovei var. microspora]|nr:hypothetical protein F4781DRAFT_143001 [Annulohypoxylon bovei var. microspora]